MASNQGGLTTSIRRKLQDGKTPEEIVQELVAGGLTELSAQRFVDRAVAEDASAPPLAPLPQVPEGTDSLDQFIQTKQAEAEVASGKTGRKSLVVGSLLMCGGILITGVSYIMAEPGQRFTLMWGPVVFGAVVWGQAVLRGVMQPRTFAWFTALGTAAVPVVVTVVLLGIVAATESAEETLLADDTEVGGGDREPFSNYLPGEGPSLNDLLGQFDALNNAEIQCDIANTLTDVPADWRSDVITGLMARYPGVTERAQGCIRMAVSKLDPKVRFPTNAP